MDFDHKYWIMVVSLASWVFYRHKGKPFFERATIMGISTGIGISLGQEVSDWSEISIKIVTAILIGGSWIALDIGTSILSDREGFKKAFWKRVGGD